MTATRSLEREIRSRAALKFSPNEPGVSSGDQRSTHAGSSERRTNVVWSQYEYV